MPSRNQNDDLEPVVRGRTCSDGIRAITKFLRDRGVAVHLDARDLPPSVAGMHRPDTREVFLNEPVALDALLVLAHEAGHVVGHDTEGYLPSVKDREEQAHHFGWRVLLATGAVPQLVTAEAWSEHHRWSEKYRDTLGTPDTWHVPSRRDHEMTFSQAATRWWYMVLGILGFRPGYVSAEFRNGRCGRV